MGFCEVCLKQPAGCLWGGRGEEGCCGQQGCFGALVRGKEALQEPSLSPNSHFPRQKASCNVPECISPSAVVWQILGALQELEAVLLFWARVCFLLLLLVPVELCCSCPLPRQAPEETQSPEPPCCTAGAGRRGGSCLLTSGAVGERSCTPEPGMCSCWYQHLCLGWFLFGCSF